MKKDSRIERTIPKRNNRHKNTLQIKETKSIPIKMPTEYSCRAMEPIMRSMECIPEHGEDDENVNPILASFHRGASNAKSEATAQMKNLKGRLDTLMSKGWLSNKEYQQYLEFLSTFDMHCMSSNEKSALKELEKEFDTVEEKNNNPAPQSWSDMFMSNLGLATAKPTTTNKVSARSSGGISSFWSNSMTMDGDENTLEPPTPLATATNRSVTSIRNPTILPPRDLANVLSDHAVADLFVETCFFARLGFVQPPCCMACTYKEALKGNIPDMDCSTWVIWRKNANRTFDPSNNANMADNAIVVQCKTARKLVTGKMVEGYQWDSHQKMLLRKR